MKTRFLFPTRFKLFGWILLLVGLGLGALLMMNDLDYFNWKVNVFPLIGEESGFLTSNESLTWSENNVSDEVASILIIIGGVLVGFSKTKEEDEFIYKIRMESLIWATYVNYAVLLLAVLLVFDMPFFSVLIYNMFTVLFIFIVRFHFMLYKSKKQLSYEE
ncbi:hypothetical protein [Urechidicola vernalis]|uniref:Uncharacterized protein n=1 Tax=Urechidicola vernalis TaxID=3075600 RepID=A0ABU2Y5W8_9FLAO|nr:hypothetical protein [Urechidicola sp. P050]MDT0553594.1 hypothetical protein [Urechidicola sp. P050]